MLLVGYSQEWRRLSIGSHFTLSDRPECSLRLLHTMVDERSPTDPLRARWGRLRADSSLQDSEAAIINTNKKKRNLNQRVLISTASSSSYLYTLSHIFDNGSILCGRRYVWKTSCSKYIRDVGAKCPTELLNIHNAFYQGQVSTHVSKLRDILCGQILVPRAGPVFNTSVPLPCRKRRF